MKFEWEMLSRNEKHINGCVTERAKVIGGWIVRTICWDGDYQCQSESSVFIPDPEHKWKIVDDPFEDIKKQSIDDLEFTVRVSNGLRIENIKTIGQLCSYSEASLLHLPYFGKKSVKEIKEGLEKIGLSLRQWEVETD